MGRPKKIQEGESPSEIVTEKVEEIVTEKEEKVEIKKSDYEKLIAQLERNAKDIDLLYKAADKHRMAKVLNQGNEPLVHTVKVWTWDNTGKVVVGTNLLTNRCEVVMGKWIEDQQMAVVLEDGTTLTVPYLEFSRKILNKIIAEIISTTKEGDLTFLKVQLPNGKKLEINQAFVN
jgi:hypothetical protein